MKKNLKSILAAFLFFMVATINVSAWDGQAATEPEIKNDVYQIKTAEDLAWFATKVNSENTVNAKLINDIDLSSKAWTPISTYKGTFDGNGKTISNLSLETPTAQAGLFAKNEGTIKDFKLTGKIISKKNMVGSVVGWNSGGTVSGITSDVLIEISSSNIDTQGGIVGQSTINSKVINNVFNGSLINTLPSGGAKKAGGIVGLNNNGSVIGNINNGRVEGPKGTAAGETGGIVAFTQFSGDGMKSHVYNNINNGEVVVASTNASSAGIVGNINATSSQNNSILIFINNLNTGKFSTEGVKISGPLYGSKSTYAKLNVVNNYFLADNTDYVTGAVSKADLQTQEAVDKLNSNDGSEYGLTIPEESKYVFKEGSMPGLTFVKEEEGPDTSVEDQKRVDEAATKINSSLYNLKPEFGKDTNVNALVKAQLVKLGFDDVNVSVKTSDDINYVGLDGAIKYFYSNPNGSNMMWFKSVPVEFNITKNKASAQHNKNAVIHWDMDKLEATTKTEIVDKIGSDNMKKDNPDLDNVTSNLDLPQHIDGKKWARITWTSSDTNIITVDTSNTSNPSHFYDPYIGKVKQSYDDKIVTLTATTKNNLVQTGQKDLIIPKDIKVTVKGVGASLSDKMQKDLDDNYTYDKLKLSKTGETLNKDNVTGDIKFPQPKETGVPDYNNYQFIVISNDPDLIANGYRGSVYRPLPGQQAKEVEFSVKMKHRNYDVAVTKDLKVTLAPLTQAEIDKEVSNMDIVKKSYFDGLNKGVNKDKNNISENLTTFQQAHVGADNKITWITNYKDQKEGGIVPVDIDITRPSEQWNLFHSSNPSVIEHEVLRVHQPAKDTKVTIKSTLSSGEYAKYATRYPDNEQFKKLNRQDVNVEVNVLGKDGGVDPEVPTKAKVSVVVEGNESTLLEETKVEVEAKDISDIVGGNASDWKERPTAMHALVKALEAKGYNVKDNNILKTTNGSYITSILGLSQGHVGPNDGWMDAIDNVNPDLSVDKQNIKDGNRIVFYFQEDYTKQYFSFFNKTHIQTTEKNEFDLSLSRMFYDENYKASVIPAKEAKLVLETKKADGTYTKEILDNVTSDDNGKFTYKIDKAGSYRLSAFKENGGFNEYTRNTVVVDVKAATKPDTCNTKYRKCDSKGRVIKTMTFYSNGKLKTMTTTKYQGNTKNRTAYNKYQYSAKGIVTNRTNYSSFKNNKYRNRVIVKRNAKNQMTYKQILNKDTKFRTRKITTYTKFTKNKYKQRNIVTYSANKKRQTQTVLKRNSKGQKLTYTKYQYNKVGKLKSSKKYGKAKRTTYNYNKKGKVVYKRVKYYW